MTASRTLRVGMLLLALVFLARLVAHVGPSQVARELTSVGPRMLLLLIPYGVGTALGALPFHVLLPARARSSIRDVITSRFAASGANAIIPLFGLGGEPVRLLWIRRAHRAAAAAAIILDRLTYALASAMFLAAGAGAALLLARLPRLYVELAAAATACTVAGVTLAIWGISRGRVAARLHRLVRRRVANPDHAAAPFGEAVDRELAAMLERHRLVWLAGGLGLAARCVLGLELYVAFALLGIELSAAEWLVVASVPVVLAFVGAVIPSQVGVQEGSLALVATALGHSPALAVSAVLLTRIRALVTAGAAWLLIATRREPTGVVPG